MSQELSKDARRVLRFLRCNGAVVDTPEGIARRMGWGPKQTEQALEELAESNQVEAVGEEGEAPWYRLARTRARGSTHSPDLCAETAT